MEEQTKKSKAGRIFSKFLLVYFITSIVIVGILAVGFTFRANEFRDKGPFGMMMKIAEKELDLTQQQKTEVEKIASEVKAKIEQNRTDRENSYNEFGVLFKQEKLDKEQLMVLADKVDSKREEMKSFFMDELIKLHAVLTPEQRTKAVEKMKEFKEKRRQWRDKHPKEKR